VYVTWHISKWYNQKERVGAAQETRATGWTTGDQLLAGAVMGLFHFATASRPAPGLTQPPIQWVPRLLPRGVKRPGHEADYSPPSSAEVKNTWNYTSTPPYAFICGATAASGTTIK